MRLAQTVAAPRNKKMEFLWAVEGDLRSLKTNLKKTHFFVRRIANGWIKLQIKKNNCLIDFLSFKNK
jgi:hypothetical protein